LKTISFVFALAAISLTSLDVSAQGRGGGGQGGRGGGGQGGRGNFDPEEFRARMVERMKEQFGFSDAEYKAIQPLIEDVQTKQRDTRSGGRGGFGGFGGRGGRGGDRESGNSAMDALQKAIESGSNIEAKLKAFRADRTKKEAALKKSQDTLKAVLTVKQEAVAVTIGLIP
jgi:hypothetical protein